MKYKIGDKKTYYINDVAYLKTGERVVLEEYSDVFKSYFVRFNDGITSWIPENEIIIQKNKETSCFYCEYPHIKDEFNYCPMCGRKVMK